MTVFKRRLAHAERLALGAWIAVVVSGSLLLATLALTLLVRWLGLIVVAAVAVLAVAWAPPPQQAVAARVGRHAARGRIACSPQRRLAIEVRGSIVPATVTEGVHHVGRT